MEAAVTAYDTVAAAWQPLRAVRLRPASSVLAPAQIQVNVTSESELSSPVQFFGFCYSCVSPMALNAGRLTRCGCSIHDAIRGNRQLPLMAETQHDSCRSI